jgi:hypothetical protein
VKLRPEAEQKLRRGFQRRADEQRMRYAAQLAYAERFAACGECGEVAGVFTAPADRRVRAGAYVAGLLPLAAIPFLLAFDAIDLPRMTSVFVVSPFFFAAWFCLCLWRGRESRLDIWLYAFTSGFVLFERPQDSAVLVRWSELTEVGEIWTRVYDPGAEDQPRQVLSAYRLRCAGGRDYQVTRSLQNVADPYGEFGRSLRRIMPAAVAATMPRLPAIDEIIATYAPWPGARHRPAPL